MIDFQQIHRPAAPRLYDGRVVHYLMTSKAYLHFSDAGWDGDRD